MGLTWAGGKTGGCYPNNGELCETGSHSEGRILPRNFQDQFLSWTFAGENFDTKPTAFTLTTGAEEYDLVPVLSGVLEALQDGGGFDSPGLQSVEWQVLAGRDFASTPVLVDANDATQGFASTMAFTFEVFHDNLSYPSARNMPQSTWAE
ncbi:MAG: hypothetical protein ACRDJE_18105 [Dehalococcoidia bacterium]